MPFRAFLALCLIAALGLAGCKAKPSESLIGGPFHLVDQNGKAADQSLLNGKWTVVYFGYTYCPDVCPATLQALGETQERLGPKARKLQFVLITVDPARDTPAKLKAYLSSAAFPKGTIGLTGTAAQVAEAAHAYRVFYQKSGSGSDYTVDHGSAAYLMDPHGRFDRVLAYGLTPDEMATQIADAMRRDD